LKPLKQKKSGGDFFSNKELNIAKRGSLPNRLSNMEPYFSSYVVGSKQ